MIKTFQRTENSFSVCKEFPVSSLKMYTLSCKVINGTWFWIEDDDSLNLDPFTGKSIRGR